MNVLFIAVDDLRPQLRCYGLEKMVSPNIDRLAATGTLFERTYCQQAVCAPSRASFMTGCRPDTTGVHDLNTPLPQSRPDLVTLPQHFKAAGYRVLSRGKIYHHRHKEDPTGWSEEEWYPSGDWVGRGYLDPASQAISRDLPRGMGPAYESPDVPDDAYPDGRVAAQVVQDIRTLAGTGQKFFMAAGFLKPHLPFNAPKRYWDLYPDDAITLADNPFKPRGAPDLAMHNSGELRNYVGMPKNGPIDDETARTLIRGYYACASYTDAMIGRLLDALDETGLTDNTAVVVLGDHGWHLGDHGLWCKHSNFETACHSPLVIRASRSAGTKPGGRARGLTEFVDIYPTLCDLAGLDQPAQLEGSSLVPLMAEPTRPWKTAAFSQYPRGEGGQIMGYSMRTDRHRLTRWLRDEQTLATELYDHETDPAENVNLAAEPGHDQLVDNLTRQAQAGWEAAAPAGL